MEETNIADVVRNTAKNMFEMLNQLADHIDALRAENQQLKQQVKNDTE